MGEKLKEVFEIFKTKCVYVFCTYIKRVIWEAL